MNLLSWPICRQASWWQQSAAQRQTKLPISTWSRIQVNQSRIRLQVFLQLGLEHKFQGAFFFFSDVLGHRKENFTCKGPRQQVAVTASCHTAQAACRYLQSTASTEGQMKEEVGGIHSPNFPSQTFLLEQVTTPAGLWHTPSFSKPGAVSSPPKHTIKIIPQPLAAADSSFNAALFPDIFEKVIQLFLSWAFSSCRAPAGLSSALMSTTRFFFPPSDSSKGDAECKAVSSENSLARAFWWWARDVLPVGLD